MKDQWNELIANIEKMQHGPISQTNLRWLRIIETSLREELARPEPRSIRLDILIRVMQSVAQDIQEELEDLKSVQHDAHEREMNEQLDRL